MRYSPRPPQGDVAEWAFEELQQIAQTLDLLIQGARDVLHTAPAKPRDGMIVVADGTDWNPGGGAGAYVRIGGAWVKL